MNFRIIKTVIAREYLTRVKKKSFIVTTILVPLIFAATMIIVGLIKTGLRSRTIPPRIPIRSRPVWTSTGRMSW